MTTEPWYETEFGGEFWLAVSASTFAFLGLALRACLKSRCTNINFCCGLVGCQREPLSEDDSDPLESQSSLKKSKTLSDLSAMEMGNIESKAPQRANQA